MQSSDDEFIKYTVYLDSQLLPWSKKLMMVYTPGVYEHTCPNCGHTITLTVRGTYCEM